MSIYVKDLASLVSKTTDLTVKQVQDIIETTFTTIVQQSDTGNKVFISGFGEFEYVNKAARKARNPRTGESVDVAPYKKLDFTPVKAFRKVSV